MSLTKYNTYKSSGIEWLGEIPSVWQVKRVKDLITKIGSGVTPKGGSEVYVQSGIPLIRSQNVYDDGLRLDNVSFIKTETNDKMKGSQLKPLDILINITGASIGRTCVVPLSLHKANINQHIIFLRIKKRNVNYLSYYLKSQLIKDYILNVQAGISKEALNLGQALNIPTLVPSAIEQTTIATFLDQKTSSIDQKISLLQQKSFHYKDLRTSLINETICCGLNKNVKLRDSGIEWIGKIPEHWDIIRLKDISYLQFSTVDKKSKDGQSNVRLCNYLDVYNNDFITDKITFMPSTASDVEIKKVSLKIGDILCTKDSETFNDIAKPAIVKTDLKNVICGYHLALVRSKTNKILPEFLFRQFQASKYNFWFSTNAKGITRAGLSINSFFNAQTLVPPLSEQSAIASYLDEKTQKIDSILTNIASQIETLKELRKTLINDVVCGKLKVTDND